MFDWLGAALWAKIAGQGWRDGYWSAWEKLVLDFYMSCSTLALYIDFAVTTHSSPCNIEQIP